MKKLTLLISILLIVQLVNAQNTFQKTYGGTGWDYGLSVELISDGYIIVGYTPSFGSGAEDVYLIKTNFNGDTLWTKTIGGTGEDHGNAVHQTIDGGFIIAGYTESFGSGWSDVYLIKTDSIGNVLWTKTYGGVMTDRANDFQITNDGGVIICGFTNSFGFGNSDVYLIRADSNGDTLWTKTIGGGDLENAFSIKQTTDNGFIFCGETFSFGAGSNDIYIVKMDSIGNVMWSKTFGGMQDDYASSIIQTTNNEYVIAGTSELGNNIDMRLTKTDINGNMIWSKTYGIGSDNYSRSIQELSNGNYIIAGYANNDACILKTDTGGIQLWCKTYGGSGGDIGLSILQSTDGGFVLLGYSYLPVGDYDYYLIKTDSNGSSGCNETNIMLTNTNQLTQIQTPVNIVSSTGSVVTLPVSSSSFGCTVTTLCSFTNVNKLEEGDIFKIYPNPFVSNFIISFEKTILKGKVEIINILGEITFIENVFNESKKEIKLKNISEGIYFVKVYDEEKSYCKKIIVE